MGIILNDLAARVAGGTSLTTAMACDRDVFSDHWIALVGTGEASGKMAPVLDDLIVQIREAQETKRKISGALTYPIILVVVAVMVVTAMLWFVVPTSNSRRGVSKWGLRRASVARTGSCAS